MIPYTEHERLALLEELERGDKVILPVSMEHAKIMLRVAQMYIDQEHQKTFNALKGNHE